MPKFYVGPVGLEYNDEGYDVNSEAISGVISIFDNAQAAEKEATRLTIEAIRNGHYVYDDWSEWRSSVSDYVEINPKELTDEELLAELDRASYVPSRLFGVIVG